MTSDYSILDIELGDQTSAAKKLKIIDIFIETVTFQDGHTGDKVILTCLTEDGEKEFKVSKAWSEKRGKRETQGLWFNLDSEGKLIKNSTLGRLLEYLNVQKLGDLIGMEVNAYPDENSYLVLTTYDLDTKEESEEDTEDAF